MRKMMKMMGNKQNMAKMMKGMPKGAGMPGMG
jgi:hypothetical protein